MTGKSLRSLTEAVRTLTLTSSPSRPAVLPKRLPVPIPVSAPSYSIVPARCMATEAQRPNKVTVPFSDEKIPLWRPDAKVPVTIHSFPALEPVALDYYSVQHLHVPLRKDLLHLAVIYEGDKARQGTAHVKTKWEVRGSHRKLYRQKGTGLARVGWRQSPIRRGGGKSHGPRPRDFSTELNNKVYDQAWRIALSYRYRRGQLIVVEDGGLDLPIREDFLELVESGRLRPELEAGYWSRYVGEVLNAQGLGKQSGRTLFITPEKRANLWRGLNDFAGEHGVALTMDDVDVKDLLERGRVVMERSVLAKFMATHRSDLKRKFPIHNWIHQGPPIGQVAIPSPYNSPGRE